MTSLRPRPGPSRYLVAIVAAYGILAAVLLPWGHLLGPDASVFAVVGRMSLNGAVPYRDVFLGKPPVLVVLSAAGDLLGDALRLVPSDGPRLLSALSVVVLALALTGLVRGFGASRPAAFCAGLAAVFFFAGGAFAGGGGLSEPLAFALALVGWWLAERSRGAGWMLLSGALAAAAVATSILAAGIALAIVAAALLRAGSWRERAVGLIWLTAGAGLVAIAVVGWLAANGALAALWDQLVTYTRAYGAVSCPIPGLANWPCFTGTDRVPILVAYAFIIAPLAAAALLSVRAPLERGVRLRLGLVLVVGIVLGLPTLRRAPSDHYWWPLVIGLLPLAAIGLDVLLTRLRRPDHRALPVAVTVLLLLLAGLGTWRVQSSLADPLAEAEAYAQEVAAITNAEPAPGPLFVWSMASPVYLVSERPPAGAMLHLYALSLPGYTDASRFEAVCRLLAERRPVIVEEYPDLNLEPGAPTPAGIDASWVEPVRRLVAQGWSETAAFGRTRILVPVAGAQLDAAACRPAP